MELETTGRVFPSRYRMKLYYQPEERFVPDMGLGTRFRLILVERGSGILSLGENQPSEEQVIHERRFAFLAPVVFCLNELERPVLEQAVDLCAQTIYFHPSMVNSTFDFENIRCGSAEFRRTDQQDLEWLLPFVRRDEINDGQIQLEPTSARQAVRYMHSAGQQINEQPDQFWPCRTRSYLLELLFLLEHLRSAAENHETNPPANFTEQLLQIAPVILYLHTHYHRKISLSELAREFHTNRTTLEDRFTEVTGQPVMSYLIQLRLRLAALMLRETLLPVSEVMERVGFSDSTHFGRTFRKYLGYSPREYRETYSRFID